VVGGGGLVGLPEDFGCSEFVVDPAAPDEEGVAEAVEISDGFGGDAFFVAEGDGNALGTAADGAAEVEFGVDAAASGKDEGAERTERLIHGVDFVFETLDLDFGDAGLLGMDIAGVSGEDAAEVEEFMLDAVEDDAKGLEFGLCQAEIIEGDAGEADGGVQFVDGAVAFDAEGIFRDSLAADEAGFTAVSPAGIDAVERDARFKEGFFGHTPW
jgi:hypothetical protein